MRFLVNEKTDSLKVGDLLFVWLEDGSRKSFIIGKNSNEIYLTDLSNGSVNYSIDTNRDINELINHYFVFQDEDVKVVDHCFVKNDDVVISTERTFR